MAAVEDVKLEQAIAIQKLSATRDKLKKGFSLGSITMQARAVSRASESFKRLVRPTRPPLPGTATPAGYVIHKRAPPPDATTWERRRDHLLEVFSRDAVTYLFALWIIGVAASFVMFLLTFEYVFNWGTAQWTDFGCTNSTYLPTPKFSCDAASGALTYSVEDYWQELSTQVLSALFTYSVLLATPWRLAILFHAFCPGRPMPPVGVDFYGRKSEFNFFHFPRGARRVIAVALTLNTLFQCTHQVCHFVWHDAYSYMAQPNGTILLITGPLGGIVWGGLAGGLQFYNESRLHQREPARFPPTPLDALAHSCGQLLSGSRKSARTTGAVPAAEPEAAMVSASVP